MKIFNKIYDYLFDVHGRIVFVVGLVALVVFIVVSVL